MSSSIQPYPSLVLAQQILTCYGYPCIAVFGTLGNLLNILLFLKKTLRTTSCNNYFLASAFMNLVMLNVGIIPILYTYDRPWAITITYFKIRSYLFNASQQMSRFLIITACFDRSALCSTNVRLRRFCSVHIARRYMIPSTIIIWLILPLHILIFNTAVNNNCIYLGAAALYDSIYDISFVGLIPPTLMLLFSLLTFRNLKLRQQRQLVCRFVIVNTQLSTNANRKQQQTDQHVLVMLMIQVAVYVSTTTMTSINLLYSALTTYIRINESNERKSIETFISFITEMLNYSCPCLSFYLFLLVSHLYRKQMKLVILHISRRCGFPWSGNNINNNVGESIPIRRMTARVEPTQQPTVKLISAITNQD